MVCWYKFRKAKSFFNSFWVVVFKNGYSLLVHGTLKSGVSHKWFYKLSRLSEWFLHADGDGIFLVLRPVYFVSFTFKCWLTSTIILSWVPPLKKKKKKVFSILKFCHWLLLEALNKIWYYLFYCTNPSMSGKILIVELLLETLSTSQIAGFCDCWWNESPDISPDGMTGSLWCYACRQIAGRGKRIYTFFIGCGAQTLLKSSVSLEIV